MVCQGHARPAIAAHRESGTAIAGRCGHLCEDREVKMPKMKTKSGAKKRFRLTASGKVRGSAAFLSHNLRRRSQKMKRKARGTMILCDADARIVKKFLPYA
jgi:large subunit ribosomal protein L35